MSMPTLVFVPGSFSRPYFYFPVTGKLGEKGYEIEVVDLPSCGRRDPAPAATMAEDAAAIQAVLLKFIDQGKTV